MSRNNHPFQVLVTKGNSAPLGVGSQVEDLAVGQIGVFDEDTQLSIDGSAPVRNFFIAVGVDKSGGAVLDSVNSSAGQYIQRRNVIGYTYRAHTASQPQVFDVVDFVGNCEDDYSIKLEFRNQKIYRRQGYNQFTHTYAIKSGCCEPCAECPSGDCVAIAEAMVDAINADERGLVVAQGIGPHVGTIEITADVTSDGDITITVDGTAVVIALLAADDIAGAAVKIQAALAADATVGAAWTVTEDSVDTITLTKKTVDGGVDSVVSFVDTDTTNLAVTIVQPTPAIITDFSTFAATYGADLCPAIRLTSVPIAVEAFCAVPTKFYKPLQTIIIPSLQDAFACNGTIVEVQDAYFEEGDGRTIQQLEYHANGWNGKPGPYRASEATGLAREGYIYNADAAEKYDLVSLEYENLSNAGFIEHKNDIETLIAIPEDETETISGFLAIIDGILAAQGFDALADDAAGASTDPAVVESTTDYDDVDKDGLS